MSLCIRFKLSIYNVIKQGEQDKFRQVNALNSMKNLYYKKQCNHKNPCENNTELISSKSDKTF